MPEVTWFEGNTTPERISAGLRELLWQLHAADNSLVPARALNLVVIVDQDWRGEVSNRLDRIGQYHASRTVLVSVAVGSGLAPDGQEQQIDARLTMRSTHKGRLGVLWERVDLEVGTRHLRRLDSIVDPLLVDDCQTVLWSPHGIDQAVEVLLPMIDVILIDSDEPSHFDGPAAGMRRAAELTESVYVVDLAWLRTTPWRERLAAAFEFDRRPLLSKLERLTIRHNPESIVSARLLAGWLSSRLPCTPAFAFAPVVQEVRGIAGVTVEAAEGHRLSLDRTNGGMIARERAGTDTVEREWRILGSSRGEGGILGNGIIQALLRDSTYGPALAAARRITESTAHG